MSAGASRALLDEQITAHLEYVAARPWMSKPNPIIIDVVDLQALLAEVDRLRAALLALRPHQSAAHGSP